MKIKIWRRIFHRLVLGAVFLTVAAVITVWPSTRLRSASSALPMLVSEKAYRPLRERQSWDLQQRLQGAVDMHPEWAQLIARKKMAVGLVDISVLAAPKAAWLNGDVMMYAASLPKIGILYAACQGLENGAIEESPELWGDLHRMIRYSSNACATRVIDRLGGLANVDAALAQSKDALFDESQGGGLWVGKRYARQGGRHPDPLKGLVHGATVAQVCRFYYLLATGRLINETRSAQMLAALASPGLQHKFVSYLGKKYPLENIFRKSGTWKRWHADSAMVWGANASERYILVALVEDSSGERILRALAPVAENVLRQSAI
jgi:beta-lactamase class A